MFFLRDFPEDFKSFLFSCKTRNSQTQFAFGTFVFCTCFQSFCCFLTLRFHLLGNFIPLMFNPQKNIFTSLLEWKPTWLKPLSRQSLVRCIMKSFCSVNILNNSSKHSSRKCYDNNIKSMQSSSDLGYNIVNM